MWLVVWLVLLDVGLRLNVESIYAIWSRGPIGAFVETEALVFPNAGTRPRIVFFGASEMREAVAPFPLADTLRVPRESIVNAGIVLARPSDWLDVYSRHSDAIDRADLVVLDLEEWHLNAYTERIPTARLRMRSGLVERVSFPLRSIVPELALGYIWSLWDLRRYFFQLASNSVLYGTPRGLPHFRDDMGRTVPGIGQTSVPWSPALDRYYADSLLRDWIVWPDEVAALRQLTGALRAGGTRVLFVQLPKRRTYLDVLEAGYADRRALWLDLLRREIPDFELNDLRAPEPWGLGAEDFLDHIHLSHDGSRKFSVGLAGWLRDRQPAVAAASGR